MAYRRFQAGLIPAPAMIEKITQVYRSEGVKGLVGRGAALAYRRGLRPLLPAVGHVRYAGIPVALTRRLGDRTVPRAWRPSEVEDRPRHEETLIAALRTSVGPGDCIVVVGGGMGVTVSVAAELAGPEGHVDCFEAARECVARVERTAELNGVSDRVDVRHAVVGRAISVWGTEPDRSALAPGELPVCEVLELDCEGAEVDILSAMTIRPRIVIVETHGLHGAPTRTVADLLGSRGYSVDDRGVAEPSMMDYCEEHDIRVLVGVRGSEDPQ